jgi:hypothetical protein
MAPESLTARGLLFFIERWLREIGAQKDSTMSPEWLP